MGSCFNINADNYSQIITDQLNTEWYHKHLGRVLYFKLLLLGPSASGKTTFLNQVNHIVNDTILEPKLQLKALQDIRQNCIDDMVTLCRMIGDEESIKTLTELSDLQSIGTFIDSLWNKKEIKSKYESRYFHSKDYSLNDNMDYFFEKITQIMNDEKEYEPMKEDIVKHKSNETAMRRIDILPNLVRDGLPAKIHIKITEIGTSLENFIWKKFNLLDVNPGWECIIFMLDLTGYCQFDDCKINKLQKSLQMIDGIVNCKYFSENVSLVIILSKEDLFKKCLKSGISLKLCFPKYTGPDYPHLNMKLPMIAGYEVRQIQKEIDGLIPYDIVELIEMYLNVGLDKEYANMTDEEYFEECYNQSLNYIKQHLPDLRANGNAGIQYHHMNCVDAEYTALVFKYIMIEIIRKHVSKPALL